MQAFFDRLATVPLIAKIAILLGIFAAVGGAYWYFFYSDVQQERQELEQQSEKLDRELTEYQRRKQEYLAFRNEVNALLEEQKELLRVLPKTDDIEQFIENVQTQVEMAGLSKVTSVRDAAQPQEMYIKIPVRMSLIGTFHQVNRFFRNVGELKRIVNIEDVTLQPASEGVSISTNQPMLLKAQFIATTFQFLDKSNKGSANKGATTSIGTGGGS